MPLPFRARMKAAETCLPTGRELAPELVEGDTPPLWGRAVHFLN